MRFRNLTIGQHIPGNSVVHRLDPRTKILGTTLLIVLLFAVNGFIGYGLVALAIAGVIHLAKLPWRYVIRGLRPLLVILLLTVGLNVFLTEGEVIFRLWFLTITREGLARGGMMGTRLVLLIVGTSLLTLTTSPIQLTDGIESLLNPFRRLGVPAHELAMMMTIALRFIPTLLEETEKIMKAQMARGADFQSGGLMQRAKSLIPLLVPLFVSAFRRADELAIAMEARGYRGGQGRTKFRELRFGRIDAVAIALLVTFTVVVGVFF
ncbi:MAG: energy-coupling factor transporter transmembrane component T [Limnochordia bacterium]|jgi:energy-coupling factor transport system permease protein|nr:energy-coupling factor transporter transmembrane component T [Limnochordia bacterium]MDI9466011.1 energy-coupling factor transporter transmembrane component T [Bacillota bacterium]NLO96176.1 energy-coupling factor transporter transmembrane protein EcfT [Bacillota bacterium]HAI52021.1 transporter [Bacillota bacterium]HAN95892.1 transporter [Bacillota bacterium]